MSGREVFTLINRHFLISSWTACMRRVLPYACLVLMLVPAYDVAAEPALMTDAELDAVAARGIGSEEDGTVVDLGGLLAKIAPGGAGASFQFDVGSVLGNGSLAASQPKFLDPSVLKFPGLDGSQPIFFENLILNLNICAECKAGGDIIQNNIGLILDGRK
jgi:hypothetical protein